ncbi:MAG: hypothetical protein ABI837_18895 [Acidobacteriota bacterium]
MRIQLVPRVTVLGIGAAVLVAFALSQFVGATPEPAVTTIVPLATLEPSAVQTIEAMPNVGTGVDERSAGIVLMHVSTDFNTGVLAQIEPEVKLIKDNGGYIEGVLLPFRSVVVYVPDERIDAFIAAVRQLPGVESIDTDGISHLTTNDPLWNQQQALG